MPRQARLVVVATAAIVAWSSLVGSASAKFLPGPGPIGRPRPAATPEMTMSGTAEGHAVRGFAADADSTFDPVTNGYPGSDPTSGFTPLDADFAGIISGTGSTGSPLRLYCIELHTDTWEGLGYDLGAWAEANVPHVGYVARVLSDYYPATNEPATLGDDNAKAAAVQAAVWFFSDRYVLRTDDPLHEATAAIVAAVIAAGPIVQPPPPSLVISPNTKRGRVGDAIGPFTIASSDGATVTSDASMFGDAAATRPIANGSVVAAGTAIFLRSDTVGTASLQARAHATVPTGNVYLYSGNEIGIDDAQKLILAQTTDLVTTVSAEARFEEPGSLEVRKTIGGAAAGGQGPIRIDVSCDEGTRPLPDFTIDEGAAAGTISRRYSGLPAGAVCTVTETVDGHTDAVTVSVTGSGRDVTIPAGGLATVAIADTYEIPAPGSLVVHKTIAGAAAGEQGDVRISVRCDRDTGDLPDFVIPAGASGTSSRTYVDIPAGATCLITETVDGSTRTVDVEVTGSGREITIPVGEVRTAEVLDRYTFVSGSLLVTKTVEGPAGGRQEEVRIAVDCGERAPKLPDFVVPAGTPAGTVAHAYGGIPAGAECTVTETFDGHTAAIEAVVVGNRRHVTIPAAGTATARLVDFYLDVPGALLVTKTIGGPAAGHQGAITIAVSCAGERLPDFVIPAGTAAGSISRNYSSIPAGARCTVTETADGHTATVAVAETGSGGIVPIAADATSDARLTDSYSDEPGSLVVNKSITGPGAGRQGAIAITVSCGGVALPEFAVPAAAPAGSVSHIYSGIAPGATCTVDEVADGHTDGIGVTTVGNHQQVTIAADGAAEATVTDSYSEAPGTLVVEKEITGPAAGRQGSITIAVSCNGAPLPPFVIDAGTSAGTVSNAYRGIPAGTTCTVTEDGDGHTDRTGVVASGSGQIVTVPAAGTATASITNAYIDLVGTLLVQKTILGPAAAARSLVSVHVDCDGGPGGLPAFVIHPRTAAGTTSSAYAGLPAGAVCTVTEIRDGHNTLVRALPTARRVRVTIPAAGTATARLGDVFTYALPALTLTNRLTNRLSGTSGAGGSMAYTITLTNDDDVTARRIVVCDLLPRTMAFTTAAGARLVGGAACWRVRSLAPAARIAFSVTARSFPRSTASLACNRAVVDVRLIQVDRARACSALLPASKANDRGGGGVTG
ncbi:MAG: DUF5979 domain-containing protein [Gaiellaceae bacterium]